MISKVMTFIIILYHGIVFLELVSRVNHSWSDFMLWYYVDTHVAIFQFSGSNHIEFFFQNQIKLSIESYKFTYKNLIII